MRTSRGNLTRVCVWLLVAMFLFTACPLAALGQEALPERSPESEPSAAPQMEMDKPTEEPDVVPKKRRLFKRLGPQPVTPEQREEAERLRKLAAKYGTDPTAIVGRLQLSSTYFNLPQGAQAVDNVVRIDLPFRRDFLLRVDAPFSKWSDPNRPGTTSAQGFSDLAVTAGWRAYNTPEYALLVGVLTTCPPPPRPAWVSASILSAQSSPRPGFSPDGSLSWWGCSRNKFPSEAILLETP